MKKEVFDLIEFIPKVVLSGKEVKEIPLNFGYDEIYISLSYFVYSISNGSKEYDFSIPRFINKNKETFEVLGLLQAEMGKTHNGCLVFANSEPRIINKVIKWFEEELQITKEYWKWYIKVNVKEDINLDYKKELENNVINYWLNKTALKLHQAYPKLVTYSKVKHERLRDYFYGTLIIEFKNNLFSEIFKNFLKTITYEKLLYSGEDYVRSFIKGIIAGEGCVQDNLRTGHYSVYISASKSEDREIFKKALAILGIELKIYENYGETLISEKENLVQLLKQRLMVLHPRKYAKFLNMIQSYPNISEETGYFTGRKKPWNALPEDLNNKIIELYNSGITRTIEIADKLFISQIKVQRVLKKNNLGNRIIKNSEELRKEIAEFAKNNPKLNFKIIAKKFDVSPSVVVRSYNKHFGYRGKGANCKSIGAVYLNEANLETVYARL